MRALVATGPGRLEIADVAAPLATPGSVVVRSRVTAVSVGTELRMLYEPRTEHGPDPQWPAVGAFGYLVAGDVTALGPDVTGIEVGDRVACGQTWGGHREFVSAPAAGLLQLPDDVSYLAGACAYWAVPPMCGILAARPDFYTDAVVVGLGPLGIAAVQLLAPMCRSLIAVDRIAARCAIAERYGATVITDSAQDAEAAVRRLLPDGAPVVIQAAGSQAALELCLRVVAANGRVANVGTLPTMSGLDLFWPMQLSGASLVPIYRPPVVNAEMEGGALGPALRARYLPDVVDMLRRGRLDIAALCTWCVPAEQAPAGFSLLREHPDRCLGMALAWDESQVDGEEEFARALTQP